MMKTLLATVGGITLLAGAAVSTYAVAGGGHNRMFNPDRMVEKAARHLDLDDAQQAEVKTIVERAMPIVKAAREDMKMGRDKLVELDPTAADYDAQVEALADTAAEHARAMVTQLGTARQEINSVLNDDQRAEFNEWLSKSKRWGRGHKRGHGS